MEEQKNIQIPGGTAEKGTIIVTGSAGFIGSCMVQYLNSLGYENLILVDDFGVEAKRKNWETGFHTGGPQYFFALASPD